MTQRYLPRSVLSELLTQYCAELNALPKDIYEQTLDCQFDLVPFDIEFPTSIVESNRYQDNIVLQNKISEDKISNESIFGICERGDESQLVTLLNHRDLNLTVDVQLALSIAIEHGHGHLVDHLLAAGGKLNFHEEDEMSPFASACFKGQ